MTAKKHGFMIRVEKDLADWILKKCRENRDASANKVIASLLREIKRKEKPSVQEQR